MASVDPKTVNVPLNQGDVLVLLASLEFLTVRGTEAMKRMLDLQARLLQAKLTLEESTHAYDQ